MAVHLDTWVAGYTTTVKPQLRAAISRLVDGVPPSEVVGLGAYTDADATSIVAVANTREHWTQQVAGAPEHPNHFRWSPGEWDLNTVGALERGAPDDLAAAVAEAGRVAAEVGAGRAGGDDYQTFRFMVWEAIVTALGQLFDEGFFDTWPDAVQVFDVPDADLDPATLADWMAEMNTDAAAAAYAGWLADPYS